MYGARFYRVQRLLVKYKEIEIYLFDRDTFSAFGSMPDLAMWYHFPFVIPWVLNQPI